MTTSEAMIGSIRIDYVLTETGGRIRTYFPDTENVDFISQVGMLEIARANLFEEVQNAGDDDGARERPEVP